jgi:hypothetical protein
MRNATPRLVSACIAMLLLGACGPAPSSTAAATAPASPASPASSETPPAATLPSPSADASGDAGVAPAEALPPPDLASTTPSADAWLGKWIGPEGTFLELARADGGYDVLVQSLDGPAHYAGVPVDAHIEFTRAGKRESIQATDGPGTGMKWLAEKHDCLVIQPSEGFCRD